VMDRINSFYNVLSEEQVLKHLQPV
jgi:hypothetical protein